MMVANAQGGDWICSSKSWFASRNDHWADIITVKCMSIEIEIRIWSFIVSTLNTVHESELGTHGKTRKNANSTLFNTISTVE